MTFSKNKPQGESVPFLSYKANYQYTCSGSGSSLDNCELVLELRNFSGAIADPVIDTSALLSTLDIPFVDDMFPKKVCVKMTPVFLPHKVVILLDCKVPGTCNDSNSKVLRMSAVNEEPCMYVNVTQDEIVYSQYVGREMIVSDDIPKPHDDLARLILKSNEPFDDLDRTATVEFRITYAHKYISLTLIYLSAFYVAYLILTPMHKWLFIFLEDCASWFLSKRESDRNESNSNS